MPARLDYAKASPDSYGAIAALSAHVRTCGLEPVLLELIMVRASQMNGCAYCIDFHAKRAESLGESSERLLGVARWRDSAFYTDRERAALDLTEAVTTIASSHVPDDTYERAKLHFSDEELVKLALAAATINAWNRLVLTFL
jgi:AhpD family alkylhydroperoxidase